MRHGVVGVAGLLLTSAVAAFTPAASAGPVGLLCFGENPTILGTDDPESISGTSGDDVIVTFGGADDVSGKGGSDRICTGGGNDVVTGGPQPGNADYIDGGPGHDQLSGANVTIEVCPSTFSSTEPDGRNVIRGGGGDDVFAGSAGTDRVLGGDGADCAMGKAGNDRILGADGPDYADGGLGNDTLIGGRGDDELTDGVSSDVDSIQGRAGFDQLSGVDNDTLDTVDGGGKDDTCAIDDLGPGDADAVVSCETVLN